MKTWKNGEIDLKIETQAGEDMALVSIIIPCYNAGEFLADTVDSALSQTHDDVEVIIVDDGSTDPATLDLLQNNTWRNTRIIYQENKGPAAARNKGIFAAEGEYILPLDADDLIDSTYVAKVAALLDAEPEVGIAYCKAEFFGTASGVWDLPPYSAAAMVVNNTIFCTALFRRTDWAAVGGYPEHLLHGFEDWAFWLRILRTGKQVRQLDEVLFRYRIRNFSRTSRLDSDNMILASTYAEVFRDNIDFFAEHAEALFRHRLALEEEIRIFCRRTEELMIIRSVLGRFPRLRSFLKFFFAPVKDYVLRKLG